MRLALTLVLGVLGLLQSAAPPRRIAVLFLGHNSTHHDSARYAPMLRDALAPDGIDVVYTADPNDLNAATLAKYDTLLIYANHTTITPEQERALLDLVPGVTGMLPSHSACSCILKSP